MTTYRRLGRKTRSFGVLSCIALFAISTADRALAVESTIIFASNYDAQFTVEGVLSHKQSRVKVRNGSTFPIEFQSHRIDVTLSTAADDEYEASLRLYEKTDRKWYLVNTEMIVFIGSYSAPAVYEWRIDNISLDLAIVVSIANE